MTKQLLDTPNAQATLEAGIAHLLRLQSPAGHWWGPLLSNVCMEAEYVLLSHCVGKLNRERGRRFGRISSANGAPMARGPSTRVVRVT
ncbi:hypothetical protein GCM10025859_50710 [Alicyclobacillus fastidiosus]|nr:hypothetical protein GCM10025859_50710 [Alicyclobacillus fastidiosus]